MPYARTGVQRSHRRDMLKLGALTLTGWPSLALSQQIEVALAGLAFSGSASSIPARFPYSLSYLESLKNSGRFPSRLLYEAIQVASPERLKIVPRIDDLKGRAQAIAVALVVGSETVSVERIAGLHKLVVQIRAQALFFDFKSMSVVRSYPLSFSHIDVLERPPHNGEIFERLRGVFEGAAAKPGIFARFAIALTKATLPTLSTRSIGVTKVTLKTEVTSNLPAYLTSTPAVAETWVADLVSEALSTRAGVPMIPYSKGYAIGNVLSLSISDGNVYDLSLPRPDYEVAIEFKRLVKRLFAESNAGASYIFGLVASIHVIEPVSGKVFANVELKNGETKLVPTTQSSVDDFPAYFDAITGLFAKFSEVVAGGDMRWIRSSSGASDIDRQIANVRELVTLCK